MKPETELTSVEGSLAAAVLQVPELPLQELANASLHAVGWGRELGKKVKLVG